MLKKIFSLLTALTVVLSLFAAVPGIAASPLPSDATLLFHDVYNTGFDFAANGYGSQPGKTTLTANGLRFEAMSGYSYAGKSITPITTGRVVYEMDFMFENIIKDVPGNTAQNLNFPKFCTTDGKTVFNSNLTASASKLAGIDVLDNQRYKYVVDVNMGTQKYFKYLYTIDANGDEELIASSYDGVFDGNFATSADKDFSRIELAIGGNISGDPQIMYLYSTRAYTVAPDNTDYLYYEPYQYQNGTQPPKFYNDDGFAADNKPVVQNGKAVLTDKSGGYLRPAMPKINAVDGLTLETEFAFGDVVPKIDLFMTLTNDGPFNTESPFRTRIENSQLIFMDNYNAGARYQIGPNLTPNTTYRLKSVMNFTLDNQLITLENMTTGELIHKSTFKFSHVEYTGWTAGSFENVGFNFLLTQIYVDGVNPNPGSIGIDYIKIYVTPEDESLVSLNEFTAVDGFVPNEKHDGIRPDGVSVVVDDGRLKVTTSQTDNKNFNVVLPTKVTEGKLITEFEFEIESDPINFESWGFPGLRNDSWGCMYQPNINNSAVLKGFQLVSGVAYKQVVITNFEVDTSDYYLYELSNLTAPVATVLNDSHNNVTGENRHISALYFMLMNKEADIEQVIYFDNIKVTRAPSSLSVASVTDVGGNVITSGIQNVSVNPTFNINFGSAVNESTINNITVGGAAVTHALSENGKTVTLTFDTDLANGTPYYINVPVTVLDIYGTPVSSPFSFSFTTIYADDNCIQVEAEPTVNYNTATGGTVSVMAMLVNLSNVAKSGYMAFAVKAGNQLIDIKVVSFTDLAAGATYDGDDADYEIIEKNFAIAAGYDDIDVEIIVLEEGSIGPMTATKFVY